MNSIIKVYLFCLIVQTATLFDSLPLPIPTTKLPTVN